MDYNYLDNLNEQQRAAVVYNDGPALVIAGAGSGKTRVLTFKIVHLLTHGFEPWRIMALTFTNKAAREMKERVAAQTGAAAAEKLWMGTFHSIFLRILRKHADLLGFKSNFTIYDAADSKSLVKHIIRDLGLDDKVYRPGTISSIISNAKNALVSPKQYMSDRSYQNADIQAKRPMTGEIYRLYCNRCRVAQAMDFDDILVYMNILLRDFKDITQYYCNYFRYILVDEYQDTNFAQYSAIKLLAGNDNHICVVGDDAQSIYSFRGANIDNILSLENRIKGLRVFKLEQNYRSTQTIINAAGSLISKNRNQMQKNVFSRNDIGDKIKVIRSYNDADESKNVVAEILRTRQSENDSLDNYAILYRTNAQSRTLEEELRRLGLGYRIHGGLSFYQRKEIKDAICYFRTVVNPDDDQALLRIINVPARGIGRTTTDKLQAAADANSVSIWNVINNLSAYNVPIHAGTAHKLNDFSSTIAGLIKLNGTTGNDAYNIALAIYNRSRILSSLAHDTTPETISQQENLAELISGVKAFTETAQQRGTSDSLSAFLQEVSLATDLDSDDNSEDSGKVVLMTVHAAKGLEFKHVFIVGLEEELFPSAMSSSCEREIEEERRLLYVAMTRAEKHCTISYADYRFRNGQTMPTSPSRFLRDIDPQYLTFRKGAKGGAAAPRYNFAPHTISKPYTLTPAKPAKPSGTPTAAIAKTDNLSTPAGCLHLAAELKAGMRIRHSKFGTGTIATINTASPIHIIEVDFDDAGRKKLMLRFAYFEIL